MSASKIEAVARAIWGSLGADCFEDGSLPTSATDAARAAIEAMREPTEAMERASRVWSPSLRESYSEMISAALNEEG